MRWVLLTGLTAMAAWGQVGGVRGGVLFDAPSRAVRVVEGVAGAAHLGGAVLEGVEAAWVGPSGKAAVARGSAGWVLVKGFPGDAVEERELGYEVERARWAAGGRYVAVAGGGVIEVWDVEGLERVVKVDLGEGREAASVAVNDAGELVVGWFDGEGTAAEAWRRGQWEELGRVAGRGVLGVAAGRTALVGKGEVAVFGTEKEMWRGGTEVEEEPAGVEMAGDEVVAVFGEKLVIWPADGGEARRVDMGVRAERLERLGGGEGMVLKLREREGEEIWVAVRRDGQWQAYFVPAGEVQ